MSQCDAQHTVGSEVRYCLREIEDGHLVHIDYRDTPFTPDLAKAEP